MKGVGIIISSLFPYEYPPTSSGSAPLLKPDATEPQAPKTTKKTKVSSDEQKANSRAHRLEKHEQAHALRKQGYRVTDIAHHLGISRRTAYNYLAAPVFPERQPHTRKVPSVTEPFKDYLYQEWMAGRHNSQQLFEEIQQQDFKDCYGTVAYYTRQLHQFNPRDPSNPKVRPTRKSLQPQSRYVVPQEPARVAHAIVPQRQSWHHYS